MSRIRPEIPFIFVIVATCDYGYLAAAGASLGRCERFFEEPAAIATCNTISNMRGGQLSDDELREIVSRQVYGTRPEDAEKEIARRKEEQRKADEEREAALVKSDQCYRLFVDPAERESCRILRMTTIRERSDEEMRGAVKERLEARREEEQQRATEAAAEKRHRAAAIEAERKRRDEARQALDARLKKDSIGFALNTWQLGGFGRVLIVRFALQNNTSMPQKDFVIGCTTRGNSGTQLSTPRMTLYERLEPGTRGVFELNMGIVNPQSASVTCGLFGSTAG